MSERTPVEIEAAPVGEQIHMPPPSILPVLNAAGLAITIVGITEGIVFLVGGGLLFLVTLILWIRSTVRDVAELPLEHH
jgi:hypothetical protein